MEEIIPDIIVYDSFLHLASEYRRLCEIAGYSFQVYKCHEINIIVFRIYPIFHQKEKKNRVKIAQMPSRVKLNKKYKN